MTLCQSQLHSGVLLLWPDVAARGLWVSDSAEQWTGTLPSLCCLGGRIDDQMIRWSNGGRTDDQMVKWWQDSWPDDQMVGGQMITTNTDHSQEHLVTDPLTDTDTDWYRYWTSGVGSEVLTAGKRLKGKKNDLVDSILAISLLTKKYLVRKYFLNHSQKSVLTAPVNVNQGDTLWYVLQGKAG